MRPGGGEEGGRRKEEGGRKEEEGGRRKEEGGRRKEEGGRRKEGGGRRKEEGYLFGQSLVVNILVMPHGEFFVLRRIRQNI
jgi:hypothetical protein